MRDQWVRKSIKIHQRQHKSKNMGVLKSTYSVNLLILRSFGKVFLNLFKVLQFFQLNRNKELLGDRLNSFELPSSAIPLNHLLARK